MVYPFIIGGDQLTLAAEEPGALQECATQVEAGEPTARPVRLSASRMYGPGRGRLTDEVRADG